MERRSRIARAQAGSAERTHARRPAAIADHRPDATLQRELQDRLWSSDRMAAQRQVLDRILPAGARQAPAQLFTNLQLATLSKELGEKARFKLIDDEYPGQAAEILANLERVRELYVGGKVLDREDYKKLARGLSEEELAEATDVRRKTVGYKPATEDVEEGERGWASGAMNTALNELRARSPQFTTGHHKVSKSKLALAAARMTPKQHADAKTVLDLAPDSGVSAFKSLGSDVSSGPNSGRRLDERGRRPDVNRDPSGATTPRSTIYGEIDLLLDKILRTEGTPGSGIAPEDYEALVGMLVQAEKLHYAKTGGEAFDADVSMWQEVPTERDKPSFWVRKSVPFAAPLPDVSDRTVRDLKKPELRARTERVDTLSPTPEALSGGTWPMRGGFKYRPQSVSFGGAPSPEGVGAWAQSGYKLIDRGREGFTYERVDPGGILLEFRRRAARLTGDRPEAPFTHFQLAMGLILLLRDGDLRELTGVNMHEFDKIRGSVAADLEIARRELERLAGAPRENGEVAKSLLDLVDLVSWFVEGGEGLQTHASAIARILSGIP